VGTIFTGELPYARKFSGGTSPIQSSGEKKPQHNQLNIINNRSTVTMIYDMTCTNW
jgi:hypothetical protein